jgi:hypothetical protein
VLTGRGVRVGVGVGVGDVGDGVTDGSAGGAPDTAATVGTLGDGAAGPPTIRPPRPATARTPNPSNPPAITTPARRARMDPSIRRSHPARDPTREVETVAPAVGASG